jgi:ribose transport system ATP-binding protein
MEVLRVKDVTKRFPGVTALNKVSFDLVRGEVHALVGENGAGKSTLIKILAGLYPPDEGEMWLSGKRFAPQSPKDSQQMGISVIHQELHLVPGLDAVENIFMGRQPLRNRLGFVNWKEMRKNAETLVHQLGIDLRLDVPVGRLSVAHQQMVEIAKALSYESQIIIMDEPTSTLTNEEIEGLFSIISTLKDKGVSIIYISHRLNEIKEITDRVTVLRDGQYIGTKMVVDTTIDEVIHMMVGRNIREKFPRVRGKRGREKLRVESLSRGGYLQDINFSVYEGEVLGIAGLVGAGRTETARAIVGADAKDQGNIYLDGEKAQINSPVDAVGYGIGLIPEDRKSHGLILDMTVKGNITLSILSSFCHKFGFVNASRESEKVASLVDTLDIRTPSIERPVKNLSGGNQQKVVLAKWFAKQCDVLIFDEPTRGIDVGAKIEIYNLINELTDQGKAIIMVSSEMPEILGMSDRIIVMHDGRIIGELNTEQASQEKIMSLIVGGQKGESASDR